MRSASTTLLAGLLFASVSQSSCSTDDRTFASDAGKEGKDAGGDTTTADAAIDKPGLSAADGGQGSGESSMNDAGQTVVEQPERDASLAPTTNDPLAPSPDGGVNNADALDGGGQSSVSQPPADGGDSIVQPGAEGGSGVPISSCDPLELPSDNDGYFVSPDGDDDTGTGSRARPFQTITHALAEASASLRGNVYLQAGLYPEALSIQDFPDALRIEGGFDVDTSQSPAIWRRNCDAVARDLVEIRSELPIAMTVTGVNTTLTRLLLTGKPQGEDGAMGDDGESVIGLLVRGGSRVVLEDVLVRSGNGGNAGIAESGIDGSGPLDCNQGTDCESGSAGDDGASGIAPVPHEQSYGTFGQSGYAALSGLPGQAGEAGHNGESGGSGQTLACVAGCNVSTDPPCSTINRNSFRGKCGCGGEAGSGGPGGPAGGAAIGILVHGADSEVTLVDTIVETGDGGAGSPGGLGGVGSAGGAGEIGDDLTCSTQCSLSGADSCSYSGNTTIPGGSPGTAGGRGGDGSVGGDGVGGPSVALVTAEGASAIVENQPASLFPGSGGLGAGLAPDGASTRQYDAP